MKRIYLFSTLIIAMLWACGNNETTEEINEGDSSAETVEIAVGWKGLAVLESGYRFSIEVPDNAIDSGTSNITYLEDLGELELTVGENFAMFIVES